MSIKFRPLGNRILVKPVQTAEKIGRIFIPEQAKEKPLEGVVFRLGTGARDKDGKMQPFEVQEGDKILVGKYGGTEMKIEGMDFRLVHADDVLAILG